MKSYEGMSDAMGSSKDDSMDDEDMQDGGADEDTEKQDDLPPEFETAAVEAFPDMKDDPDRLRALYSAIESCHGSGGHGLAIMLGMPKGKK